MLTKIFKILISVPIALTLVVIVAVNIKLSYYPQVIIKNSDTINYELVKELRGLKTALDQHADIEMQNIYPEGYVFLNSIYALAWSSFLHHEEHKNYISVGRLEIENTLNKIQSSEATASFNEHLPLPYGAFYSGWSTYVLGLKLKLEKAHKRKSQDIQYFKQLCNHIAEVIQVTPYPESYEGGIWPADVLLGVASLCIYDRLFEPKYETLINTWLKDLKKQLDHNGMIPHSLVSTNGKVLESARGSSHALMLVFLKDIDTQFAQEQFELFTRHFLDTKFGLTGIREYPIGNAGNSDIDSGPVILGFGGAATIVGMQTLALYGEFDLSLKIRNEVEALAFPINHEDSKYYFFGLLPIADAFITWGHSKIMPIKAQPNFARFRSYSIVVFLVLSFIFWFLISKRKPT